MDASRENAAEQRTAKHINMEEKCMKHGKCRICGQKFSRRARGLRGISGITAASPEQAGGRKAKFSLTRRGI